jgi:hypothetical protein
VRHETANPPIYLATRGVLRRGHFSSASRQESDEPPASPWCQASQAIAINNNSVGRRPCSPSESRTRCPPQPASRLNGTLVSFDQQPDREVNRVVNTLRRVARLPRPWISCQGVSGEALGAAGFPRSESLGPIPYTIIRPECRRRAPEPRVCRSRVRLLSRYRRMPSCRDSVGCRATTALPYFWKCARAIPISAPVFGGQRAGPCNPR